MFIHPFFFFFTFEEMAFTINISCLMLHYEELLSLTSILEKSRIVPRKK